MTEEMKNRKSLEGKTPKKDVDNRIIPWLVYVSLTVVVVFGLGAYFQIQIVSLQRELAALRLNLSVWEDEKVKNLHKRSSNEFEEEEKQGGDTQAAHLQGSIPFQHIEKEGRIGPWSASTTDDSFISLKNRNTEIEITQTGTYYIYAQVYYLTSETHNSFQILSYNRTSREKYHKNLGTCSTPGRNTMGEVSCHTAFTVNLHSGYRLYLNQIEQNRIIHFTNGCSYFGVILLKKNTLMQEKT